MEDLLNQILQTTIDIKETLFEILNKTKWSEILVTMSFSVIVAFIGALIGACFSQKNEKKKFLWNCYINFLSIVNTFLSDVTYIIKELADLERLPALMLNEPNEKVNFTNWKDYKSIVNDINEMKKTISNLAIDATSMPIIFSYKELYLKIANDVIYFDKFSEISSKYERSAVNYYHLISGKIKNKSENIIKQLEVVTNNDMSNFDIWDFKRQLIEFVKEINYEIDSFKINTR